MSGNIWLASDHHFGHAATFEKFKNDSGSALRPFTSIEEMNEAMVERHNAVVRPNDKVYFLGDVVMNKKFLPEIAKLNGQKRLIMGNHDTAKNTVLSEYFTALYSMRILADMILTHIPIHPSSVGRFGTNVHGHLHGDRVMWDAPYPTNKSEPSEFNDYMFWGSDSQIDPRYISVCVEQIDYTPISLEDLRVRIKHQREVAGYQEQMSPYGNGSGPG
jgi:calcineurin-like phosphoesterase family protein